MVHGSRSLDPESSNVIKIFHDPHNNVTEGQTVISERMKRKSEQESSGSKEWKGSFGQIDDAISHRSKMARAHAESEGNMSQARAHDNSESRISQNLPATSKRHFLVAQTDPYIIYESGSLPYEK